MNKSAEKRSLNVNPYYLIRIIPAKGDAPLFLRLRRILKFDFQDPDGITALMLPGSLLFPSIAYLL